MAQLAQFFQITPNHIKSPYFWHFWASRFPSCSGSFLGKMLSLVSGPQHAHFVEEIGRRMSGLQREGATQTKSFQITPNQIKSPYFRHFWASRFALCSGNFLCKMLSLVSGVSSQELKYLQAAAYGVMRGLNLW